MLSRHGLPIRFEGETGRLVEGPPARTGECQTGSYDGQDDVVLVATLCIPESVGPVDRPDGI